tara:strand:+ start:117 stop:3230 length:3114 start_codon:yes stop_codon:yes gene_type:complete
MAGYTKTYSGDLTTTIASKLFDAVKNKIEKNRDEKRKEQEELKKELDRDDSDAIPVKNSDMGEFVTKMFGGGISLELTKLEGKVDRTAEQVSDLRASNIQTVQNIVDHNNAVAEKLDTIADLFRQKYILDKLKEDLSETRSMMKKVARGEVLTGSRRYVKRGDQSGRPLSPKSLRLAGGKIARYALSKKGTKFRTKVQNSFKRGLEKIINNGERQYKKIVKNADYYADRGMRTYAKDQGLNVRKFIKDQDDLLFKMVRDGDMKIEEALKERGEMMAELADVERGIGSRLVRGVREAKFQAGRKIRSGSRAFRRTLAMRGGPLGRAINKNLYGSRVAAKRFLKKSGKLGTKLFGKAGKFVPGLGTIIGIGEAVGRFATGDPIGGLMSLGSAIPIVGWGFTAADIARDMGYDPLNTLPEGYETGTSMLTNPGEAILHGRERVELVDPKSKLTVSHIEQVGSQIASTSLKLAKDAGVDREVFGEITNLPFKIENVSYTSDLKKTAPTRTSSTLTSRLTDRSIERNFVVNRGIKYGPPDKDARQNQAAPITTSTPQQQPGANTPATGNDAEAYDTVFRIGPTGDTDGQDTGLNMTLAGGIGTPIYAPRDLVYKEIGTDGMPAVGLQGNPNVVESQQGHGFGYYGAYFFEEGGKEYEVLLGHFKDLPYKGQKDGDVIPAGTLLGYQGASGNTDSGVYGGPAYPHISLHVNGIGFKAGNEVLVDFAKSLRGSISAVTKPVETEEESGGGGIRNLIKPNRNAGGGPKNPFRNDVERRVYIALKNKGFSQAQIAAIMANFDIETLGYTTMYQLGGGPGRGLAQWEIDHAGNNFSGRWPLALKWYESTGRDPDKLINDVEGQIDWMMHEFTNIPTNDLGQPMLPHGYTYDLKSWKNSSTDPAQLAENWMKWYEAPGTPHEVQRYASARNYNNKFSSSDFVDPTPPKTLFDGLYEKGDDGEFYNIFDGTKLPEKLKSSASNFSSNNEIMQKNVASISQEDDSDVLIQTIVLNNVVETKSSEIQELPLGKSKSSGFDALAFHMARLSA